MDNLLMERSQTKKASSYAPDQFGQHMKDAFVFTNTHWGSGHPPLDARVSLNLISMKHAILFIALKQYVI
jgi:hypothetical protein